MSYSYKRKTTQTPKSPAFDDTKRKSSLLKDSSWIKKDDDEDEDIDRDPNFAKSVLGRYRSSETLAGPEPKSAKSPTSVSSVQALSKRFSSQDELNKSSTLPARPSYTRSTSSTLKSDPPKTTSSTLKSDPPKTTTTTTTSKDGTKTTETTTTTTRSTPKTTTNTFRDRVFSDVKSPKNGTTHPSYTLPSKTTKVPETTEVKVTGNKTTEDELFDTLIPTSIKDEYTTPDSKTSVSKTETVTVRSSKDGDGIKTTTTKSTSSTPVDDLYDTLLPKAITSGLPTRSSTTSITKRVIDTVDSGKGDDSPTSPRTIKSYSSYNSTDDTPSTRTSSYTKPSDEYTSPRRSYSSIPDPSYEYTSVTSPTVHTTPSYSSRDEDPFKDPTVSKSSLRTVHSAPERAVLEKDMCSYCRKPFNAEAKMVLEDMRINCHASCFKCGVCNGTLGHLKAGDSMWIYKRTVHCENCFDVTREQWRR